MKTSNDKFLFGIAWWSLIVLFWFLLIAVLAYYDQHVRSYESESETVEIKTKEVHCNCVCTEAP